MGVIATALKHLIAAGLSGDDLVRAVADMEEAGAEAVADTRSTGAKRQARYRERNAERNEASQTVTRDDSDVPTPFPAPPNENNLTPPTHTPMNNKPPRVSWACPDGVEAKHWSDFMGNRKRKRLATSESAYQAVLDDLAKLSDDEWPPGRLVQLAAGKSWGSINYPSDGPKNGSRNGTHGMAGNNGRGAAPARIFTAGAEFVSGASGNPSH